MKLKASKNHVNGKGKWEENNPESVLSELVLPDAVPKATCHRATAHGGHGSQGHVSRGPWLPGAVSHGEPRLTGAMSPRAMASGATAPRATAHGGHA